MDQSSFTLIATVLFAIASLGLPPLLRWLVERHASNGHIIRLRELRARKRTLDILRWKSRKYWRYQTGPAPEWADDEVAAEKDYAEAKLLAKQSGVPLWERIIFTI